MLRSSVLLSSLCGGVCPSTSVPDPLRRCRGRAGGGRGRLGVEIGTRVIARLPPRPLRHTTPSNLHTRQTRPPHRYPLTPLPIANPVNPYTSKNRRNKIIYLEGYFSRLHSHWVRNPCFWTTALSLLPSLVIPLFVNSHEIQASLSPKESPKRVHLPFLNATR